MVSPDTPPPPGQGIAIVHDYLTQYGGAEKVLEALHALWPAAPIFTTFFDARTMYAQGFAIPATAIHPLLPDRLRPSGRALKLWTPLYPEVFRRLDLRAFRLVLSSTSFAAHQVRAAPGAVHVAYVHSPPRFLYGLTTEIDHRRLRARVPGIGALYAHLRRLDQQAARRVTAFIANSEAVRRRIRRFYGRDAAVIHPPVDTRAYAGIPVVASDYFLTWSRLVASKRIDTIVEAATRGQYPLVVAGTGPEERRLRRMAGSTVRFAGHVDHQALRALLARCRAVIFAADEDFGIVPVEAMAAGRPVLAFGSGGACETVLPGETGELFGAQTATAVLGALATFRPERYDPARCRERAARFDRAVFERRLRAFVEPGAPRAGTTAQSPPHPPPDSAHA